MHSEAWLTLAQHEAGSTSNKPAWQHIEVQFWTAALATCKGKAACCIQTFLQTILAGMGSLCWNYDAFEAT